ncbi:FAD:protein FMN transferase [Paenibacillus elgii]|uniref:FAD:protein FMN transferase n=1 Tax=Paenibacillus elgii TaxID=189691 RepID=UPI0013D0BB02|nr:FAD:protein FMN transferase [Paenibacillus elgii]
MKASKTTPQLPAHGFPAVEFKAMGTEIAAIGRDGHARPYWCLPVIRWFEGIEGIASRFQANSELSRFNRAPAGRQVKLSPRLYSLIRSAWSWHHKTVGLFQPFVGSELCRLGYHCSFEKIGTTAQQSAHAESAEEAGRPDHQEYSRALILDDQAGTAARNVPASLDLGGMGKGWTTDRAALLLRDSFRVSQGLVDAGGDMRVWSDGEPWPIGVQSPFREEEEWLRLWLKNAAVATSNIVYRQWEYRGKTHHHILNGRTGQPAETDIVQATVLGHSVEEAEVAAKVICMIGSEPLSEWMQAHFPRLGYIAITRSGSIKINRRVYDYAEKVVAL